MNSKIIWSFVLLYSSMVSYSQVVTLDPYFVAQNDTVTVTYDASLGNGLIRECSSIVEIIVYDCINECSSIVRLLCNVNSVR